MNYTLQQLRYLVGVADHGSVSAAARALYVSQPGVSAAITHLESTFGIQCFVRRHAKGVTLTPAGRTLADYARNLLREAEGLRQRANELNCATRGRISLGCSFALSSFLLEQIVETMAATYPEISLQIRVGDVESLCGWMRNSTVEAGIMCDLNCDSTIFAKHHLASLRPHALLPASHPLAAQTSVSPDDIASEPLILLNCVHDAEYLSSIFQPHHKGPRLSHCVADFELVRRLVAAGKGYTILNILPEHADPGRDRFTRLLPIKGETLSVPLIFASMRALKPTALMAALLNACNITVQRLDPKQCEWADETQRRHNRSRASGDIPCLRSGSLPLLKSSQSATGISGNSS